MSRGWVGSSVLVAVVVASGAGLAAWKLASIEASEAEAANQPEPMEVVTLAVARQLEHRQTTTSIGTVVALRSISLRNEIPGTVRRVALVPGEIVEAGTVLVALDVSVEEAELKALQVQSELAETLLARTQKANENRAVSESELDRARSVRDVALAQIARLRAVIERKTMRAPFRARLGISDVHEGQYLEEGTLLTTLQGVDDDAYIDFTVAQRVAAGLHEGEAVEVFATGDADVTKAVIVAIDARVDPATRNATVRAKIRVASGGPSPGASVRVRVPVGASLEAVGVPLSALRKGPAGDHVFVLARDESGAMRAQLRRIETGPVLENEVVIEDGLHAGEEVAASGSFKLRDGALVALSDGPGAAGPGAEVAAER